MNRNGSAATDVEPSRIACVGLGVMGGAMALRLLQAGFRVSGVDPTPQAARIVQQHGGDVASSPREAAQHAQAALIMVSSAKQVEHVLFGAEGLADAMPPGAVVWIASTIPPSAMREFAEALLARGLQVIDGPVSGGRTKAESGDLTVIAGGQAVAMTLIEPYMRACASNIYHVGDIGTASTIKIINNLLAASHVALTAEAMSLGAKAGVSPALLAEVIERSSGASQIFMKRARRMASGDHEVHASIQTFLKDLDIADRLADELSAHTPMSSTARALFTAAAEAGWGNRSDTELVNLYAAPTMELSLNRKFVNDQVKDEHI